jgi:hypothetical protein
MAADIQLSDEVHVEHYSHTIIPFENFRLGHPVAATAAR